MKISKIAEMAHEVNRLYCESIGDTSQLPWAKAPKWQKDSAIDGVKHVMKYLPETSPASASHDNWLAEKKRNGWKYGKVKDEKKKTHPCFVPYDKLPKKQKAKDYLFISTVHTLLVHG